MIDQERAEKATQFLIDTANDYGTAKAEALRCSNRLRHVKALAMKASGENSIGSQEREAYASHQYSEALEEEFEAVKSFEILKATRDAAAATIDYWRSANSNLRAAGRGPGMGQ